jgi:hypothetical protein
MRSWWGVWCGSRVFIIRGRFWVDLVLFNCADKVFSLEGWREATGWVDLRGNARDDCMGQILDFLKKSGILRRGLFWCMVN